MVRKVKILSLPSTAAPAGAALAPGGIDAA